MPSDTISVGFFYRVLPSYRLAIMEELARQSGIDLMVYYSTEPKYYSLKTVDPGDRFPNRKIEMKAWRLGSQEILYQPLTKAIIESGKHDVIVLSANPRLLSNFPALYTAKRKRIGIVWWSLGLMANQSPVTMAIRRWLMRIPDAVVLYTKDERDYFVGRGVPPEKVFVAQNTISVGREHAAVSNWDREKGKCFLRDRGLLGKKLLLYCARIYKNKQPDLLLLALQKLVQKDASYHLVVIGSGEYEDGLKKLAAKLHLEGHISWLGPLYDPELLAPWYLGARVKVIPSAIGLASYQSFAYGLPVITSADMRRQSPEAVALKNGYNCLLYKHGNVEDLKSKIETLSNDDRLWSILSANATRTMTEEYTVEKMVRGFVDAIRFAYSRSRTH
jgi:glycosyltransferase involved in cell wall biosynthesis